jgi:hypothetical protein
MSDYERPMRPPDKPQRPTFKHHDLREQTRGYLERMRAGGAPAWLIAAEENAQRAGYTMRRLPGLGEQFYRVPLATAAEELAAAVQARDLRLSGTEPLRRMPDAGRYDRAPRAPRVTGYRPAPDQWEGEFDKVL